MALSADLTNQLKEWASQKRAVSALWLFGSRARQEERPSSDYDIALELMPKVGRDDAPFTDFFFGYEKWKAELRLVVAGEISLICFRDGEEMKFDPRKGGIRLWARCT